MTCARREAGAHRPAASSQSRPPAPPQKRLRPDPRSGRRGTRLFLLLPVLALLLGAPGLFAAAPAQAQTVVWTATLTVGEPGSDRSSGAGYCAFGSKCPGEVWGGRTPGSLSPDNFTLDGTRYRVESIRWGRESGTNVHLLLDKDFPDASLTSLTLQIGTHSFALSDAARSNSDGELKNNYRWPQPSGWSHPAVSSTVTVKLLKTTIPAKPAGLTATPGNQRVTLAWTDPSDSSITKYQVRQKAGSADWGSWTDIPNSAPGETNATSYTVTGLNNGTEYRFRIRAVNAAGDGPQSAVAGPATPATSTASVSGIAISSDPPSNQGGQYKTGDSIAVTVTFNEVVTVTGAPTLRIRVGSGPRSEKVAACARKGATGDDRKALVCSYTVKEGDEDANGIAVEAGKLTGSIQDSSGNPAALTYTAIADDAGQKVDGVRPEVTAAATGYYSDAALSKALAKYTSADIYTKVTFSEDMKRVKGDFPAARPAILYYFDNVGDFYDMLDNGDTLASGDCKPNHATKTDVYVCRLTVTDSENGAFSVSVGSNSADGAGNMLAAPYNHGQSIPRENPKLSLELGQASIAESGAGNATTVKATLPRAASAAVTVTLGASPADKVTFGAATVTIPSGGTESPTTSVTAVDNDVDAANATVTISGTTASTAVTAPDDVTLEVTDDDTKGVTLSTTTVSVDEGATATYTVKLDSEPTADVVVTPASDDTGAVTVSTAAADDTLTFTASNWDTPQTVTVTGVEDADNADESVTVSHALSGEGSGYRRVSAGEVTVSVDDDEPATTNSAATGKPSITGTATVGQTLTAAKGSIADTDGVTKADNGDAGFAYTYQWIRVDSDGSSNPADIPGATSSTYVLAAADQGKRVKVKLSFQDDAGNAESRTSDAYPASGTVAATTPTPTPSGGIWSATLTVDYASSRDGSPAYGCDNGSSGGPALDNCSTSTVLTDDDFDYPTGGTTYTIDRLNHNQGGSPLYLGFSGLTAAAAKTALTGLTLTVGTGTSAKTFAIADATAPSASGSALSWSSAGLSWSDGDTVALKLTGPAAPANVGPAFSSAETFSVAENETAVGTVAAADADSADSVTYAITGGADRAKFAIVAATGVLTFAAAPDFEDPQDVASTTPSNDAANNEYVLVVTATGGTGARAKTAAQTITVTVTNVDEAGSVTFGSTTPTVDEALTASVEDPDGGVSSVTWQWAKSSTKSGTYANISGATSASYTPAADDTDAWLRATAGYTDAEGTGKSANAVAAAAVAAAADTTRPTVTAGSTGYYGEAGATTALTGPLKSGADIYTKVTFSEDMKHVKSDAAAARPELFHRIGTTDTRYHILDSGDTLASGDCRPEDSTSTDVYICRYTVGSSDSGAFTVKAGTSSVDTAGNALAAAYTHTATLTLDNTAPTVTAAETGFYSDAALSNALSGTVKLGANIYTKVTFSEDMKHAKSDTDGLPEISVVLSGTTAQRLHIVDSGDTPAALDCKPNHATRTNVYACFVATVSTRDIEGTGVGLRVGTDSVDEAGNALASVYDHASSLTIDNRGPSVEFPSGAPTVGTAATITLADATSKVAKYGIVEVDGAATNAEGCDDPSASGDNFSTTAVSPAASPKEVSHTPATAGKKICVYAEDGVGNSHAALWSTAIAAANVAPAFSSAETFSVAENETAVGTVAAADADSADSVTYAITGGADQAKFAIVAATGVLTFAAAPDFEDPQDAASTNPSNAAANNEYVLVVTATGGTGARAKTAEQTIVVTVTNVDEDGSVTFGSATPRVGDALTASVEDPDGGVSSVTWQWAKSSTKGGTYADISGATSASYTPAAGDAGAWLRATAGYTDAEGTGKSAAAVAAAAVAAAATTTPTPSGGIWSATLTVDHASVYAGCGTLVRLDDCATTTVLTEDEFRYAGTDYTIIGVYRSSQSLGSVGTGTLQFRFSGVTGAAAKTALSALTLTVARGGASTALKVSEAAASGSFLRWTTFSGASWGDGDTVSLQLTGPAANVAATGKPSITGTATVGETLTAAKGTIADANGVTKADNGDAGFAYTYQWIRVDSDGSSNAADIPGATSSTYVLKAADRGKKVKVKLSFQDDAGNAESRTSDAYPASGTVAAATTTGPAVSGIAVASSPPASPGGWYKSGNAIEIEVTFDKAIEVTGAPELRIRVGTGTGSEKTASCARKGATGEDAKKLTCSYTVATGDEDTDGISVEAGKLSLPSGAAVKDGSDNDATLTYAASLALAAQSGHKVDAVAPSLTVGDLTPSGPAKSKTVTVTRSDSGIGFAPGARAGKYWFVDASTACNFASFSAGRADAGDYFSDRAIDAGDEAHNGRHLCVFTSDLLANVGYAKSAEITGIDSALPEVTATATGFYGEAGATTALTGPLKAGADIYTKVTFSEDMQHVKSDAAAARPELFRRIGSTDTQYHILDSGDTLASGDCRPEDSTSTDVYICFYTVGSSDSGAFTVKAGTNSVDEVGNALAAAYTHAATLALDTTAPTVTAAATGYFSDAGATTALTGPPAAGSDVYTKVTFSEDMQHVKSDDAAARPELSYSIGTTDTRYHILDSGDTLASGDCKPEDSTSTDVYICRYTWGSEDSGAFRVKAGTGSADRAGNALAAAYTHAAALTNEAPAFTSSATFDADENQTAVGTVAASDSDSADSITGYAITGGADRAKFAIVAATGVLTFAAAPDFEDPQDAASTNPSNDAANNEYVLVVTATGGTGGRARTAAQTIVVTVTNVEETGSLELSTNSPKSGGTITATLSDPDGGLRDVVWQWRVTTDKSSYVFAPPSSIQSAVAADGKTATSTLTLRAADAGRYVSVVVFYKDGHGDGQDRLPDAGRTHTSSRAADGIAPAAPSGLALASGTTSPGSDATPSIEVTVGETGGAVTLYSDAMCTTAASAAADVTDTETPFKVTVDATALTSDGSVTFHATHADAAGNASACSTASVAYVHDGTDPGIVFPDGVTPTAGTAATIALTDATAKVAKYGAIAVVGTSTDATGCDTAAEVGSGNLTTLATPASPVDFEYTPPADSATKKVCAYAEDAAGNSHAALWSTAIAAANVAPAFSSAETFSVAENETAVGTVAAADADSADSVTYAITGGADRAKFAIVAGTGVLTFAAAPDFEDPQDAASTTPSNAAANNEYVLVVTATGGTGARAKTAAQTIVVTVTNVDEDGSVTFGSATPRVGDALTASVEDPDGGVTSVTWQWAKSSTKSGTYADISGATSASYTPAAGDTGAWLRATAGYTDAEGTGKSAAAVAAAAVTAAPDTTAPTVASAETGYYAEAGATTALTGPLKSGADIYTKVTFSEDMKHVKSDAAAARPELFRRIGTTDTQYHILDSGDTLASGDCKPEDSTSTDVYICFYTVGSSDSGAFTVKAGTNSVDKAGNALAAAYTHAATLALDTTAPAAPVSLAAEAGDAKVTLTWSDPSPADATISKWQYRQKTTGSYGEWQDVTGGASARRVEVGSLSNGTAYTFQVRAVDTAANEGAAGTTDEVTPAAANAAPAFSSAETFSVAENQTAVGTVAAADADSADSVTGYAITGGADQAKFAIVAGTGVLTFAAAPDFEDPQDAASTTPSNAAANNEYVLVVTATGGTGARAKTAEQTIVVTVTNVDEDGSVTFGSTAPRVGEALTASVEDPDGGVTSVTWQWAKSSTKSGTYADISGATSASYTPAAGDAGAWLRATAGYTDAEGTGKSANAVAAAAVAAATTTTPSGAVWSATLTVQASSSSSGCSSSTCSTALTQDKFTHGGIEYTITEIYVFPGGSLTFYTNKSGSHTALSALTLTVGSGPTAKTFKVSDATMRSGDKGFFWTNNQGLSWSANDMVALALTAPAATKPAKPTGLTATAGDKQVALSWTDPSDSSITKYQVQQKAGSAAWGSWTDIPSSSATTTSYTATGLTNGTAYRFRIRAVNATGNSPQSAVAGPATPASSDTTAPTVASGSTGYYEEAAATTALTGPLKSGADIYTKVTFSEDMKHVKSDAAAARPELSYRIGTTDTQYHILDSGDTLASGDCKPEDSTSTDVYICFYTVGSSDSGAFTVKAGTNSVDEAGNALAAAYTHAATLTLDTTAPAAPVSLAAEAGDAKVTLTWSDPSPADATISKWQYRQKTTGSYGEWQDVTGGASARRVEVGSLANGTAYTFQVRAVDTAANEGAAGTTDEVTPAAANAAPAFSSDAAFSVAENQTAVGTVAAADADSADSVTYAITGGADQAKFAIVAGTGVLTFAAAPDFEDPQDAASTTPSNAAANNEYVLVVTATGGTGARAKTAAQTIVVTVTNVDEDGSVTFGSTTPRVGDALTASVEDPDGGVTSVTWQWAKSSTKSGTYADISGATSASYTPAAGDTGAWLRATAGYTDAEGTGKSANAVAAAAVAAAPDTTAPTVASAETGYYAEAGATTALTGPLKSGADIYTKVTFSEDMKHVKSDAAAARPELFRRIGTTDTQYHILDSGDTLASGDCKPEDSTSTDVYICFYTVGSSDSGAFTVKAGTNSVDEAGNALAAVYTHAATLTLDTTAPAAPVSLAAEAGDAKATLTWSDPSPADATISKWQYRQKDSGSYGEWQDVTGGASARRVEVGSLSNGTAYTFQVRAVDTAANEGAAGTTDEVTPAASDTTAPTVTSGSTGYFSEAGATTTLTGPLKSGADIYTKVTFSEDMKHVKSDAAAARPELSYRIGTTDTQYHILDSGDTLASGDCKPEDSTSTDVYICFYTVGSSDSGAFTVKAGTNSADEAGNSLAAVYTHAATLTLDTTGPSVSSVAVSSSPPAGQGGHYKAGDAIAATVTFDEAIVVTATPKLEITVGTAAKSASCARKGSTGEDAKKLVCTYTVASGDADADGVSVAANKLTLPAGAAIKDAADNDATRTHAALAAQSGHKVDAVAPAAPSALALASGTTSPGADATPSIEVTVGETGGAVTLYSDAACTTAASAAADVTDATSPYTVTVDATALASDGSVTFHAKHADAAGNASACSTASVAYVHDGTDPGIAFPDGVTPTAGTAATIALTDATAKIAKYGAIPVAGASTDATGCDTAAEVGTGNLTTLATPASPVDFEYTPPADSATKKVCAYAEDAAGKSHAALWSTAIAAATTTTPSGGIWSATLTVDQASNRAGTSNSYGCDNASNPGHDMENCSKTTVLTDDDFDYPTGGPRTPSTVSITIATVPSFLWGSAASRQPPPGPRSQD